MTDIKHAGDPTCICGAFHLDFDDDDDSGWGHCLCGCHGSGDHLTDRPCPCNTERKEPS
jgi:hypothetical protein